PRDRHLLEGRRRDVDRRGQPGGADPPGLGCGRGGARQADVVPGPPALTTERTERPMDSISRRAFLGRASVVTLALGGTFPRPAHAAKPESVSMRLGWLANAQYAG